jgi:signal transduction histidine kinase
MNQDFNQKSKFPFIWAYSLVGTLIVIASLYFVNISIGIENFSNTISLSVYTIVPGLLVVLSIWAITKSETIQEIPKKSLVFLVFAFSSWFIAEQTWNLYEHVLDIDPYPSMADFFYLAAPIFMFVSLTFFLKSTEKKISKKMILFSSIISLLILIPSLVATFNVSAEDEPFEVIIALTYPIVDSIVFVPAIITISFLISNRRSFFWIMIIVGLLVMLAADTAFLFLVIEDEYVDGHPVDILWVSSYTIWTFMMFHIIMESKQFKDKKEFTEIYKKYGTKKIEKYGVIIGLIVINTTVVILLIGINFLIQPSSNEEVLPFFSWILAMMIVIFSSVIILLNSKLNKTLQSRTQQLEETTSELIKSERFSAIGELASRISHDIRNPLSNIHMSIELIKNSAPETKVTDDIINEKLELVSKNVERISHQINDVLGFIQNRQIKRENVNISSCLHETIESLHIPNNIVIKSPKIEKIVSADFFQLQIVFNNLLLNGIQAIGTDNGEILIRFSEEEDNEIIEFENSGPSIPEEILPHVFDSLVTTKQVGTGLGLVSCKTIIENHKGQITVRNNPTVFTILLPKLKNFE